MIFLILQTLQRNPEYLPLVLVGYLSALILAFTLHELAHAWVAYQLGDFTAARQGRLTLNPMAHLDPVGMLLILLAGFGWAKPVPVNPYALRIGPKAGMAVVALAGPATNILLAVLFALPFRLDLVPFRGLLAVPFSYGDALGVIGYLLTLNIFLNVLLAVFNMLPVAPLDGFKIAVGIAPKDMANWLLRYEQYGIGVLFAMFALGWFIPQLDIIGRAINPVITATSRFLVGV